MTTAPMARIRPSALLTAPPSPPKPPAEAIDRYELYELCVQTPHVMVRMLESMHGGKPRIFREDFSGAAANCRAWVQRAKPGSPRRAIAVDLDPEPLARLAGFANIKTVRADVRRAPDRADIIAALNFPLGYFFKRSELVAYLRACRRRLLPRGMFVADIYGGRTAFSLLTASAQFQLPDGTPVRYSWEHREADPTTARVVDVIHFRVGSGRSARWIRDAFVYEWRLWSIPELADAYREAGFDQIDVYEQTVVSVDAAGTLHCAPIRPGDDMPDNYVAYVVGRAQRPRRSSGKP